MSETATKRLFSSTGEATTSESTASSSSERAHVPAVKIEPAEKLCSLLSRKRQERSSPIASPLRSTRSPHTKRARTFAEAAKHRSQNISDMEVDSIRHSLASNSSSAQSTVQLGSFQVTASEQSAVDNLNETLFSYVLMKEASGPDKLLVDLKTFCGMTAQYSKGTVL